MKLTARSFTVFVLLLSTGCGNLQWPPQSGNLVSYDEGGILGKSNKRISREPLNSKSHSSAQLVAIPSTDLIRNVHIVVSGETLSRIARAYNTNIYALAILNKIEPPFIIYPGQRIEISSDFGLPMQLAAFRKNNPSYAKNKDQSIRFYRDRVTKKPVSETKNSRKPSLLSIKPSLKPTLKIMKYYHQSNPRASRGPKSKNRASSLGVIKETRFIWPVKGKLLYRFGPKRNGLRNDGINILAPRGSRVRAAGPGVVIYAGDGLRGFGNLLLIKHNGDWVTAYAHNQDLIVKRGTKVFQGQVIARVGSSGNVVKPQLHFEIRNGNKAVDPILRFGGSLSNRIVKNKQITKS